VTILTQIATRFILPTQHNNKFWMEISKQIKKKH